jgi:hypothetical protein
MLEFFSQLLNLFFCLLICNLLICTSCCQWKVHPQAMSVPVSSNPATAKALWCSHSTQAKQLVYWKYCNEVITVMAMRPRWGFLLKLNLIVPCSSL